MLEWPMENVRSLPCLCLPHPQFHSDLSQSNTDLRYEITECITQTIWLHDTDTGTSALQRSKKYFQATMTYKNLTIKLRFFFAIFFPFLF